MQSGHQTLSRNQYAPILWEKKPTVFVRSTQMGSRLWLLTHVRLSETLGSVSKELREHDRRITRLEAQWETALKLSAARSSPGRRLKENS
jgi:hypothetical protein